MRAKSRLTVMQSIALTKGEDTYAKLLHDLNGDGVEIRFFSWRAALFSRYKVFHLHWPEHVLGARTGVVGFVKYVLTSCLLIRLRVSHTPVVRTVHNLKPHDDSVSKRLERILAGFDRLTKVEIHLVEDPGHLKNRKARHIVIPHVRYGEYFAPLVKKPSREGQVASFGLIKPYKGFEQLVEAFKALDADDLSLKIVGGGKDAAAVNVLVAAALPDPRVTIDSRFVSDAELVEAVSESELIVLPYEFHSSGVAILALSLDRPILVRGNYAGIALRSEVGARWVHLFDDTISPDALKMALTTLRAEPKDGSPDLTARDPDMVAKAHRDVYRSSLIA